MENENLRPDGAKEPQTEMYVNDYGATRDGAVVVEEPDRTVLLTENETVVIPKEPHLGLPPKNRARKVYAGMWGTTELVTVGLGLLAVLTTVLLFVFLVLPAQKEYEVNSARRDELVGKFESANRNFGSITTTEERVRELTASVEDFESRLPNETVGRTELYQRLNGLIAAYGLTNSAGPDYAPLEVRDTQQTQQSEDEKGRSKYISIYPGVYVTMTVDGSYQSLRRFIREIESSGQLVIVTAVELEPSENKEKPDPAQPQQPNQAATTARPGLQSANPALQGGGNPNFDPSFGGGQPQQASADKIDRGKTRGETVTLRLEMAAYFRRAGSAPVTTSAAP